MRIIPLYYAVLMICILLLRIGVIDVSVTKLGNCGHYGITDFIYNILFLGYLDRMSAYALFEVDWTLPIEMTWYVILPMLIAKMPGWKRLAIWWAITMLLATLVRSFFLWFRLEDWNLSLHFFPSQYGYYFVAGAIAHKIRFQETFLVGRTADVVLCLALAIFVANCLFSVGNTPKMFAVATFFVIISYRQQFKSLAYLLENDKVLLIGNISYSLYLVHMPIILLLRSQGLPTVGLAGFSLVYGLGLVVAYCTTVFFELPIYRWHRYASSPT